MRILRINNFHFLKGGSDRYFLHVTDLLKKEGHEVATFSADHPLSIHRDWLATSPPHGTDTENPKSVMNIVNYLYSFDAKKNMELAIERFKPDIAHLHIYYGQLTSSILAPLKAAGIPIVQTLHEYKLVCPTHALYAQGKYCDTCQGHNYWKALSKRCNRGSLARTTLSVIESYISDALGSKNKVDHYIAVSEFQKQQLVRLGIPQEKLSVLYHFSDLSSAIITKTRNHFLYVGRIEKTKV